MEKKRKSIIFVLMLMLILLRKNIFAIDEIENSVFSDEYIAWMQLTEEEKQNTIQPFPIEIEYSSNITTEIGQTMSFLESAIKQTLFPTKYDLRDYIDIEIKHQKSLNSCWTFSSNSAIETYLALRGEEWNFSERHIEYATASNFTDGNNPGSMDRRIGSGGNSYNSFAYYSRGQGPILEIEMPFEDNENEISIQSLPTNSPSKHIEGMKFFTAIIKKKNGNSIKYYDKTDMELNNEELVEIRNEIKEHIMVNGGISSVIYYNEAYLNNVTYAYNNNTETTTNHVVTIIGWDDEYSANNFKNKPSTDGAYIALNSWGKNWGENGIFYISYEDLLIERYLSGITAVSEIDYTHIYQHDVSPMSAYLKKQYAANVFTAEQDEILTEVVIGLVSNQKCNIYINPNGDNLNIENLTQIANNVSLEAGYNTIKLDNPIELKEGNKFAVIVKIIDYKDKSVGIESNINYPSVKSSIGESYTSADGVNWNDIYDANSEKNFIIKALTKNKEEENIEIKIKQLPNKLKYLKGEELDITGLILVEVVNGNYEKEINLDDENLIINSYNPNWIGEQEISIEYKGQVAKFFVYVYDKEIESEKYYINQPYIYKIEPNTTKEEFDRNITEKIDDYKIMENNKEITSNEIIKTGQKLIINNKEYTLVVTGDLNGDGKVKASDLSTMKKHLIGKSELKGAFLKAADMNDDGQIKASDMSNLKKKLIGH